MLQSMYANPGEFVLDDPSSVEQIQAVLSGDFNIGNLQTRIGFTIKIFVENEDRVSPQYFFRLVKGSVILN